MHYFLLQGEWKARQIDNPNSKLEKVLNVLNEISDESDSESCPKFWVIGSQIWEPFFETEDFMLNYGITGKNIDYILGSLHNS